VSRLVESREVLLWYVARRTMPPPCRNSAPILILHSTGIYAVVSTTFNFD